MTPLRVLLVEDLPDRQAVLASIYRGHAWVAVTTGARAITLLTVFDFDIISLDYNLGGELTGADVAAAIATSRHRATRVVVHSQNPRGAAEICTHLPAAVRYPVSRMVRSNAVARRLRAALAAHGADFSWDL